jgi:uncharacterized protein (TIGR03437 family)
VKNLNLPGHNRRFCGQFTFEPTVENKTWHRFLTGIGSKRFSFIDSQGASMTKGRRCIHQTHGPLLLCASVILIAAQTVHAQSSILNTNLIKNGNAEAGPASPDGKTVVTSIPSWTVTGKPNVLPYGLTGHLLLTDPAPQDHGFQYFAGDPHDSPSTLTQPIDVSSLASIISTGNVRYTASAYLGSTSVRPQVVVAFQNANGQQIIPATLGPGGFNGKGTSLQQEIGLVPPGTMQITVTLTLGNAGASADSLSLVLTTLGTSPSSVLGRNLVLNGGAEDGPGIPNHSTTLYVPNWSTNDGASVCPYGGTGWIQVSDPGPADRGRNLFCGGPGNTTTYQDVDVSAAATLIDADQVTYEVSAWLGSTGAGSPTLTYLFFDWSGTQLAPTAQLGPASHSGPGLVERSGPGTLPPGTRRVHIGVLFPNQFYVADDIAFTLAAPSGPPVIDSGGIITASAFGGSPAIAPGSLIEIYGINLTTSAPLGWGSAFKNGVAPTQLGDVSVSVGGKAAFVNYISPSQVNALVSSDAPTGPVTITLTNSNGISDPFPIYVDQTQPGLLAPPGFIINGKQYVAAVLPDGTFALPENAVPGVASRPAKAGETVVIYGVGFGPVTNGFIAGSIVTGDNSLTTPVQFFFGSTPATTIPYDGLAPALTGLYQFDIVVPNVGTNNALPFSFDLGGAKGSQKLYIAVQN